MNPESRGFVTGAGLRCLVGRTGEPLSGRNWGDRLQALNSAPNMPQLGQKEGSIRASHLVKAWCACMLPQVRVLSPRPFCYKALSSDLAWLARGFT